MLRILSALAILVAPCVLAETNLPAFPGAGGFGRFAKGGRGGAIYHVTNLNDSGPGSFRDAVSRPKRTVVFDVGGVIRISRRIAVSPNVTIAGQTAPGDGVVVYGNGISFSGADNSITRHIRFRMGSHGDSGKDAAGIAHGHDMIFDHVSVSWGRDENFSINGPATNISIQDCIIAQGLQHHSAGGLIQTAGGVTILRTLYADNFTRNPKVKGVNEFVNNVVYNWGHGGAYILGDSAGDSFANVMNSYFIAGPDTGTEPFTRGNTNFHLYATNNFEDRNRDGVLNGAVIPRERYGVVSCCEVPFGYPTATALSPVQAWRNVTAWAGASLRRDAVDRLVIAEVASFGKLGRIITNETDLATAGPGTVAGGKSLPDSDQDGMPDAWETATGLDPNNPEDRNRPAPSGYTQLEEYLNWLAEPHLIASNSERIRVDLREFTGGIPAASFQISNAINCTAVILPDGYTAQVEVRTGFAGRAGFRFATTGWDPIASDFGLLVIRPEGASQAEFDSIRRQQFE
ncbi:MAG TPA: pectate lyase [Candidatus Paceibacterota bacterium]|nr:pectate lyase [Candidatus Paceibacterota bacterium]